jgi:hypothetical protein
LKNPGGRLHRTVPVVVLITCAAVGPRARAQQVAGADTTEAGAYLDAGAAQIVRRARERREGVDRSLLGYRALASQRIGVGLRALRRDRILYHQELAARIEWHRGDTARVEALGAVAGVPIASDRGTLPDGLRSLLGDLAFDPDRDLFRFGVETDSGEGLRHPLAPGSEAYYRFRSGDTTVFDFPDGRKLRVVELEVIPRRSEFRLVSGVFWFDASTYGLVRAVFRPARPFDLAVDADSGDADEVPAVLRPVRVDIRYLTIEYGLEAYRWWLPRIVAADLVVTLGKLAQMPVRFERLYRDYQVDGGGGLPPPRPLPLPVPAAGARGAGRGPVRARVTVRLGDRADSADSGRQRSDSAFPVVVLVPSDTAVLASSPYLPPAFFEPGAQMVSEAELREIGREARLLPSLALPARAALRWAPRDPTLLRYNRVEGLSLGAQFDAGTDRLAVDAAARIGWADRVPNAELGLSHSATALRLRFAAYYRLAAVDPDTKPFGIGNSLGSLVLGRDDGDYYRALGAEITVAPALVNSQWYDWRLYAEQQRPVPKETDASLPRLFSSAHRFRENVSASAADQLGASLTLRAQRGADPTRPILGARAYLEAATGTFALARGSVTLRAALPLPVGVAAALEVAGGSSVGTVPPQALWYLGGPATMRGYGGAAAAGEAFWRARLDLASRATGARLVLFGDAGWAGARTDFGPTAMLLSWGVGASFLDGLVRLDLARALRHPAGWRVDLYWDGAL